MGALESRERTVPLAPMLVNKLREWETSLSEWRARALVPNGAGRTESHANIIKRGLMAVQIVAGMTRPYGKAKYTGLHALRHFAESDGRT